MRARRIGCGSSIRAPSRPLPSGRCPIRAACSVVHADVHELGEPAVRGEHAERGVPGPDQLAGGLGDPAQHHRQGQPAGDRLGGAQQPAQPALGRHHLLRAIHQLRQQLVQLQARQVEERQLDRIVRTRRPPARGRAVTLGGVVVHRRPRAARREDEPPAPVLASRRYYPTTPLGCGIAVVKHRPPQASSTCVPPPPDPDDGPHRPGPVAVAGPRQGGAAWGVDRRTAAGGHRAQRESDRGGRGRFGLRAARRGVGGGARVGVGCSAAPGPRGPRRNR